MTKRTKTMVETDRRRPPQSAPHRCQPVKREAQRANDPPDHRLFHFAPRRIRCTKGGLNSKLPVVCDGQGRPNILLLKEGQMSDHIGAFLLLDALRKAQDLLGDQDYDSDWFRTALTERGVNPCIPPR
jgi:hypothetical protein